MKSLPQSSKHSSQRESSIRSSRKSSAEQAVRSGTGKQPARSTTLNQYTLNQGLDDLPSPSVVEISRADESEIDDEAVEGYKMEGSNPISTNQIIL